MPQISFVTAKQYLQGMHPEYDFIFTLEERARKLWGYGPDQARALQSDIVAIACAHAKGLDAAKGIHIVIKDETCDAPGMLGDVTHFSPLGAN